MTAIRPNSVDGAIEPEWEKGGKETIMLEIWVIKSVTIENYCEALSWASVQSKK